MVVCKILAWKRFTASTAASTTITTPTTTTSLSLTQKLRSCKQSSLLLLPALLLGSPPNFHIHKTTGTQARNMSFGIVAQHSKCKDLYEEKTCRFCNPRQWKDFNKKKKQLTCVLCLSFVAHRLIYGRFMGCNATGFLSLPGLVQRSLTDPPKENGRKFAPTAPIASKFRLGNTW